MSISRLRKSRGFSIAAAIILAALLTLAAVAIQATLPSENSPASMSAATAASSDLSSDPTVGAGVVQKEQDQAKAQLALKCAVAIQNCQKDPASCGKMVETKSNNTTGNVTDNCVGAVPDPSSAAKYRCTGRTAKATFLTNLGSGPGSADIQSVPDGSLAPGVCKTLVCQPTNASLTSVTQLKCSAAMLNGIDQNSITGALSSSNTFTMGRIIGDSQFTPSTPLDSNSQKIIDSVFGNSADNSGSIPFDSKGIIGTPSSEQIANIANATPDATAQQESKQITAMSCENNPALCGNNSSLTPYNPSNPSTSNPNTPSGGTLQPASLGTPPDSNQPYYIERTDENGKQVWCDQNGECKSAATFTPSAAQGGPGNETTCKSESCVGGQIGDSRSSPANGAQGPCPDGSAVNANGNCPSTNKPPVNQGGNTTFGGGNTSGGNTTGGNIPTTGQGNNWLSNLLGGGNNNAASNVPQSPFGGACSNRYVCSGNMLYYQTVGVQYGVPGTSCVTQPVQQCQYGCMAVNGVNGVNGTNGSGSFLSDFGTGLQIASQVLRIFGGGSNNTVNTNLSSQCAMTPQQAQGYQSPYGTGTDGQQCYQPPQQPDPSQCTAGTWKPTSSTGNGCTTGWQCVPSSNNNGTTTPSTKPTAQLSCQPQIADVGMPISFSFSCGNASASTGTGFSTGGAISGTATAPAPTPPSGTNQATFTLTCVNQGITASAQCQVQLNKPGIVLVTNPKKVASGSGALIGWVTAGMQSCAISSPDDQNFTARNAGNTSPNGAASTSPITTTTRFQLDCQTLSGATKSATTSVSVN